MRWIYKLCYRIGKLTQKKEQKMGELLLAERELFKIKKELDLYKRRDEYWFSLKDGYYIIQHSEENDKLITRRIDDKFIEWFEQTQPLQSTFEFSIGPGTILQKRKEI